MKITLYILTFFIATSAFCQNKEHATQLNLMIGAGLPETFHGGVRVNHNQWHYDASIGSTFGDLFTLNGNAAVHFGSKNNSDTYDLKPWYTSLGISYMQWESSQALGQDTYLNGRIGRDFKMNDWFKLSLSLGLGVNIYHYKYDKKPSGWDFDIWVPVIPSGQFSLQFKVFELGNASK